MSPQGKGGTTSIISINYANYNWISTGTQVLFSFPVNRFLFLGFIVILLHDVTANGTKMEQVPKFLINLAPQFAGEVIVLFPLLLVVSNKFSSQIVNHPRDVELKKTKRLYSAN